MLVWVHFHTKFISLANYSSTWIFAPRVVAHVSAVHMVQNGGDGESQHDYKQGRRGRSRSTKMCDLPGPKAADLFCSVEFWSFEQRREGDHNLIFRGKSNIFEKLLSSFKMTKFALAFMAPLVQLHATLWKWLPRYDRGKARRCRWSCSCGLSHRLWERNPSTCFLATKISAWHNRGFLVVSCLRLVWFDASKSCTEKKAIAE